MSCEPPESLKAWENSTRPSPKDAGNKKKLANKGIEKTQKQPENHKDIIKSVDRRITKNYDLKKDKEGVGF